MNQFKVGDKVIISKESDILDVLGDFFDQELEIIDFEEGCVTNVKDNIIFKSLVTGCENSAHYTWFKKSPQRGDKVKILSKGIEGDDEADYTNYIGAIQDVSYLDKFPYRVLVDNFADIFVKEVEIIEIKRVKPWLKEDFQNIHVIVTPEQSEKLQKYLLTLGISLLTNRKPQNLQYKHLFVTEDFNVEFSENLDFDFSEQTILFEDIVFPICESRTEDISGQLKVGDLVKIRYTSDRRINNLKFSYFDRIGQLAKVISINPFEVIGIKFVNDLSEIFVSLQDIKIVETKVNVTEQLSISDEAKYQIGEINNNYADEIMSTHYKNIDKINLNIKYDESDPESLYTDVPEHILKEISLKLSENKSSEMVNHPNHYQSNKIEVIDIIDEFNLGFDLGNVVKYILRSEKKGKQLEDLQKASWYLNHKIKKLENEKRSK